MSKRKLLVVDDDEAVLHYLRTKLGARYELTLTRAPEDVLELARKQRPDLILCDIDMPGPDGGDVSSALFGDEQTRDIPVLFLSVLVKEGDQQVGGRAAISKSAPLEALFARIESLLK